MSAVKPESVSSAPIESATSSSVSLPRDGSISGSSPTSPKQKLNLDPSPRRSIDINADARRLGTPRKPNDSAAQNTARDSSPAPRKQHHKGFSLNLPNITHVFSTLIPPLSPGKAKPSPVISPEEEPEPPGAASSSRGSLSGGSKIKRNRIEPPSVRLVDHESDRVPSTTTEPNAAVPSPRRSLTFASASAAKPAPSPELRKTQAQRIASLQAELSAFHQFRATEQQYAKIINANTPFQYLDLPPDKLDCAAPPPGAPAAPPSNPTLPPALANIKLDPTAFSKWHIEMTEKLNQRRVQMQAQPSKNPSSRNKLLSSQQLSRQGSGRRARVDERELKREASENMKKDGFPRGANRKEEEREKEPPSPDHHSESPLAKSPIESAAHGHRGSVGSHADEANRRMSRGSQKAPNGLLEVPSVTGPDDSRRSQVGMPVLRVSHEAHEEPHKRRSSEKKEKSGKDARKSHDLT